jgi:hypothetical protein
MGTKKILQVVILIGVWGMSACKRESAVPPGPPPAQLQPRADLAEPARDAAVAVNEEEEARTGVLRFFPGADSPRSARSRQPTAVLLFAPPGSRVAGGGLASVSKLRFQPVVCALRGKLATGARCGEAMPARVKVRLTESGSALGLDELELERATAPFRDEAGEHVYPAPYGPACCMYNTCVGKTVPYYPKALHDDSVLTTDKTILAVWPADAEIDLSVFEPGRSAEVKVDDGPWTREPDTDRPLRLGQTVLSHGRRYASVAAGGQGRGLFANVGSGWKLLLDEMGVREYFVLAASDLDGDGRPELLVYARWANDYGLHVLANDEQKPSYGFSCGNI